MNNRMVGGDKGVGNPLLHPSNKTDQAQYHSDLRHTLLYGYDFNLNHSGLMLNFCLFHVNPLAFCCEKPATSVIHENPERSQHAERKFATDPGPTT